MQTINPNADCEVAVEDGRILVTMGKKEDRALDARDFAGRTVAVQADKVPFTFYAALNQDCELVRVASMSIPDRAAVAALVAGWIAEGLSVQQLTLKELGKAVRAAEKREKEEIAQSKPAAEPAVEKPDPSAGEPSSPEPAPRTPFSLGAGESHEPEGKELAEA